MWQATSWVALTFHDGQFEDMFSAQYTTSTLWPWDWRFLSMHTMSLSAFVFSLQLGWVQSSWSARLWTVAHVLVVIIQYVGMSLLSQRGLLPKYRSQFICVIRACDVVLGPLLTSEFFKPAEEPFMLLSKVCVGTCCCLAIWQALGMPFLYKHQVLAQLASLLYWGSTVNNVICQRIYEDPASAASMVRIWNAFAKAFDWLFDVYFPVLPHGFRPSHRHVCQPVVIQLQYSMGFVIPLFVVYQIECQSRLAFLEQHAAAAAAAGDAQPWIFPARMSWKRRALGAVLVLLLSACIWQASNAYYSLPLRAET